MPETVASPGVDNSAFTFDHDDNLIMEVSGGGRYKHQLWNYAVDSCVFTRKFCGFATTWVAANIELRKIADNRYLVLIQPTSKLTGLWATLANWWIGTPELKRYAPTKRIQLKNGSEYVYTKLAIM
jgi:hypothetical protein